MDAMIKNKKADIPDLLVFVITATILAVGLFIFAYVIPQITDGLKETGINESAEVNTAIDELEQFGTVALQRGFFFIFVGLVLGLMLSAFFIRTHPIFIFLYIIFLGLAVFIGFYMGYLYEQVSTNPIFAETLASQTLINFVMKNIIKFTLGIGALSIFIIFAKYKELAGGPSL